MPCVSFPAAPRQTASGRPARDGRWLEAPARSRAARSRTGRARGTSGSAAPPLLADVRSSTARRWRSIASPTAAVAPAGSACAPPGGSGMISSMTSSACEVRRRQLQRLRRFLLARRVLPEDRGAALGRDDGIDRVLEHEDAVADAERERAAGAALAGDRHDDRHAKAAISRRFTAIASAWPRSSASIPG